MLSHVQLKPRVISVYDGKGKLYNTRALFKRSVDVCWAMCGHNALSDMC